MKLWFKKRNNNVYGDVDKDEERHYDGK